MMREPHKARSPTEPLCSRPMSVLSHGDPGNRSVGMVIPVGVREELGIGPTDTIEIHCFRSRAVLARPDDEAPGEPIRVDERTPVRRGGSLQVNIPFRTRLMLGIEAGDQVLVRSFADHCEIVPLDGGRDT